MSLTNIWDDIDQIVDSLPIVPVPDKLSESPAFTATVTTFCPNATFNLSEQVYWNRYYRKILRAKIEREYASTSLIPGLVITGYANHVLDERIVSTLRLLRVTCKFLGIANTTERAYFPLERMSIAPFWIDLFPKFIPLFGEERLLVANSPLEILATIFYIWSGTHLKQKKMRIRVEPSEHVERILPRVCL